MIHALIKNGGDVIQRSNSILELETIFTEHWKHARHCENERLWFTNVYAVVVAAILYSIAEISKDPETTSVPVLVLALFGLILSVLGFLVVITLTLGHLHHITDIVMIFYRWDKMEFYTHPKKPVYFMNIHRYFYEITIALFLALFLFYIRKHWFWLIVALIISVFIEVSYRCKWKKYSDECWRLEKALKNDTKGRYRKDWNTWFRDPDSPNFRNAIVEDAEEMGFLLPLEESRICKVFHRICRMLKKIKKTR